MTQERMASNRELALIEIGKVNTKIDHAKNKFVENRLGELDQLQEISKSMMRIALLLEGEKNELKR